MSKYRLQVLMDPDEARKLRQFARRHKKSVGECVRHTIQEMLLYEPRSPARIRAALDRAAKVGAPAPDIDQMNAEIEQGYLSGEWPR